MKKSILASAILLTSLSIPAFAANFYVGPTIFAEHITGSHSHVDGVHPRLSVGFSGIIEEDYYLAAEVFAIPTSATFADSHSANTVSVKIDHSFGLSLLPGIMLTDDLLGFLRLGVIQSRFDGISASKTGGQVGAGLQTQLTKSWDLRGEFIYTEYKSSPTIGTPRNREVGIGVTYQIC